MEIQNNQLHLGGLSAEALRINFGSPLYVYEEDSLRSQCRRLLNCFEELHQQQRLQLHFAMKANSNPSILKVLREEGAWIDAVSPYEVQLALDCGYRPEQILFTGNNTAPEELDFCVENGVPLNIGSLFTLEHFGKRYSGKNISLRVNPGVGAGHHAHCITGGPRSKFGIYHDQLEQAQELAQHYSLRIIGIQSHIGTGIFAPEPMLEAMEMILALAERFTELEFIDFGGGFGIPYRPEQQEMDVNALGQQMTERFEKFCKEYGRPLSMKLEPGRYLVGPAGFLLLSVTNRKHTPEYQFVGTDSGFHHLVRPTMYGSYHRIWNASRMEDELETVAVVGNVCETGDFFSVDQGNIQRDLQKTTVGDCLVIADAGAYGFSMSSQYNSRPRPAEVLVKDGQAQLIRRAERYTDLLRTTQELD